MISGLTGGFYELVRLTGAAALMFVTGSMYSRQKRKNSVRALFLKGGTTFIAVLVALSAAFGSMRTEAWLIAGATVCCMTADVLLELYFTAGSVVFGIGHLLYMASYFKSTVPSLLTVVLFLLLFGGMYVFQRAKLPVLQRKMGPAFLYGGLLCAMTAMAFAMAAQNRDMTGFMTAAGAACFFISDNLLIKKRLTKSSSKVLGTVLLFLYYAAVFLIAAGQTAVT